MASKDLEHGSPVINEPKSQESDVDRDTSLEKKSAEENGDTPASSKTNQVTFPEGGLRAWCVVAGTAGTTFCQFGYANAFGVFEQYYLTHKLSHETPSAISWIGSIQMFLLFSSMLFGGPLFDRYGEKVIWGPVVVYLFTVFMTSLCTKLWHFMLCQGILGGLSMGLSMGPSMAACGHYFLKKRGAAMGLAVAGSSLGGVIFPIAISHMLYSTSLGFGWTVRITGFLMMAILIPACIAIKARLPPRHGKFFLPNAFKEPIYVCIVASVWFMILGLFTPFFYLPTFAVEHGMSAQLSSYLVSILNGSSFFGRVVPGILADKIGPLNMIFAAALSTGILIFCWQAMTTDSTIVVFSALYGFCSGAIISLMSFALANIPKNPRDIGTYLGMGMACSGIAALIGPPINGALVSRYKSFDQSLDMSGAFLLVGATGILIARHFAGKGLFGMV